VNLEGVITQEGIETIRHFSVGCARAGINTFRVRFTHLKQYRFERSRIGPPTA
jgi:hypothetical protein